ncbi:MAG: hypothetical protein JW902_08600, partial [Syntrophaceae bacterium]|nr:hypothetical protein [Syntrophaceae bacterium]
LFREGLTRPLPFFPQSSLDYAAARAAGKSRGAAMNVARKAWQSTDYHRGEESDPYIHLCFEKTDPFNEAFCALAETIYTPLLKYRHKFSDMERVLGETCTGMP